MDQDDTWHGGRPWSSPHCDRWRNSSPAENGAEPPQFSAHLYCGQTAGCIKVPLGTEVDLGLRDIVFDVDPATPRKKGTPTPTQFLAHIYCGQMAGWMKTPLGTEVDLGQGHIVLDGVPAPAKGAQHPLFSAHVYCGYGRPSQLLLSSCLKCKMAAVTVRSHQHRNSFQSMVTNITTNMGSVTMISTVRNVTEYIFCIFIIFVGLRSNI